jgi:trans-aconitate methyltransferase
VLAAMLLNDPRFAIGRVTSVDLDPACANVARAMNGAAATDGRFEAVTADMHALDYAAPRGLVINTSCEHIADVRAWLDLLPRGQRVALQSNDFVAEPSHVACDASLEAFAARARLASVSFAGAYPARRYTRFMLIGVV